MEMLSQPPDDDANRIVLRSEFDARGILATLAWGVMATMPAEVHAVNLLARHVHKPTVQFVYALLHLCKYLLLHRHDRMRITAADAHPQTVTYVDSSHANDGPKSWYGYCLVWCQAAYAYRSRLASPAFLSSRDSEAYGAVQAVRAMLGARLLLAELGFGPKQTLELLVDNKATVDGAMSEKIHKDSRHTALRLRFIRDHVRLSLISITHVVTTSNLADIFTKLLPGPQHHRIRNVLMGTAPDELANCVDSRWSVIQGINQAPAW
jgi:hypothetical protein